MRLYQPILLCLLVASCASAPDPQAQTAVAVNCRFTEPQTGSHIVHKDTCPLAMTEDERDRHLDDLQKEMQRMQLLRRGQGGGGS